MWALILSVWFRCGWHMFSGKIMVEITWHHSIHFFFRCKPGGGELRRFVLGTWTLIAPLHHRLDLGTWKKLYTWNPWINHLSKFFPVSSAFLRSIHIYNRILIFSSPSIGNFRIGDFPYCRSVSTWVIIVSRRGKPTTYVCSEYRSRSYVTNERMNEYIAIRKFFYSNTIARASAHGM